MEYFDQTVSSECDCNGVEPIGLDDDGAWFGTENCWLVLNDYEEDGPGTFPATPHFVTVAGKLLTSDFAGHVVASNAQRAIDYFDGIGCLHIQVISCDKLRASEAFNDNPWAVYVTDEEAEAIKEPK